ncbi:fimbrial assembly chaperone, partial [Salmonella enterica subsp. enterica serovar Kentucky]|nr:fimbrial assembly chaperone [Salmonella enterica subsp. enterica serovar Kentucky]EDD5442998.1 fimbrial assembly chaperone [Salmonella enterica subsp. enterica serovar Kentucky]EHF6446908.1 fimbrial assembly chaperone [Salmonella enterica subsp. enterica serovar Derby]
MKHIKKSVLVVLLTSHVAHASIVVGGTRLVFDGNNDESSINVENKDSKANLVQSWLSVADPQVTNKQAFIITPPLFRLDAGQKNSIRVIRSGAPLPADRESMYWLNIKGIPSIDDNASANRVEISINTQIKLIYRPPALTKSTPDSQSQQLKWQTAGDVITVNNPTPYYMNFASVT